MPISVLVPVAVFMAMGIVVVLSLWRIVVVGGEARRGTQSLRLASDVAHRAEGCIAELAATVDALRHRRIRPDEAAEALVSGSAALSVFLTEARAALARASIPPVSELVSELERAHRSLELIEHGRELMEIEGGIAGRRGDLDQAGLSEPGPRPRRDPAKWRRDTGHLGSRLVQRCRRSTLSFSRSRRRPPGPFGSPRSR